MNQNYICCKCNQPVKQPCCQMQSPKSAQPPTDCPFGYTAEWERSEFIEVNSSTSNQQTHGKIHSSFTCDYCVKADACILSKPCHNQFVGRELRHA